MRRQGGVAQMTVMAAFCLSCVALLLFLWSSFGGAVPFSPRGYQVQVTLHEGGALTRQAEVRIAGVDVGRVVALDARDGATVATLELEDQVVPLPRDARATMRQKTILGEAYVELSQGSPEAGTVPDGGRLPASAVRPSVEFDEVLRAFDPRTRTALRAYLHEQSVASRDRGADVNDALGDLPGTEAAMAEVLDALDAQGGNLEALVRDTSRVFEALGERRGRLGQLLVAGDRVFSATAERDRALEDTVRALPALERETRAALPALTAFAGRVRPAVGRLRPLARELSPTLTELGRSAPDLRAVLAGVGPLADASRAGLPALRRLLADLPPALGDTDPFLAQLEPTVRHLSAYRGELTAFLANATAATQATSPDASGTPRHYLRTTNPINPEVLTAAQRRVGSNRANPYAAPGAFAALTRGLATAETAHCDAPPAPFAPGALDALGERLASTLDALTLQGGSAAAPACRADTRAFPHVTPRPLGRTP